MTKILWAGSAGHGGVTINGLYSRIQKGTGRTVKQYGKQSAAVPPGIYEGAVNRSVLGRITTQRENVQFINPGPVDIPMKYKSGMITAIANHEATLQDPRQVMGFDLHTNAARGRGWINDAGGFTLWHYPGSEEAIKFARILEAKLAAKTPIESRGLKSSRWFHMLRKPSCPMLIIEMLFHTNIDEAIWAADFENQILLGDTIGGAMDIYERVFADAA